MAGPGRIGNTSNCELDERMNRERLHESRHARRCSKSHLRVLGPEFINNYLASSGLQHAGQPAAEKDEAEIEIGSLHHEKEAP